MLKQCINECRIRLQIQPQGAVLIKAGESVTDGLDMSFVRTMKDGLQQVYLPGSSLKGVMRTYGEAMLRSFEEHAVCNLFRSLRQERRNQQRNRQFEPAQGPESCSYRVGSGQQRGAKPNPRRYQESCPACKLFGSLAYGGRFNVWDAYSVDGEVGSEFRDGVGIDRFSGGAFDGAKYQFEVITSGTFNTEIVIKNFEMWQLAWVLFVLRDMSEGLVPIGMGTSRGLGKIKVAIEELTFDFFSLEPPTHLYGIGRHQQKLAEYGVLPDWPIEIDPAWQLENLMSRQRVSLSAGQVLDLLPLLKENFACFLKALKAIPVERAS